MFELVAMHARAELINIVRAALYRKANFVKEVEEDTILNLTFSNYFTQCW